MNQIEYVLTCVIEECNELAQRACKIQRFGLTEIQPGQEKNNAERLIEEWYDLVGSMMFLRNICDVPPGDLNAPLTKIEKIRKYMKYSKEKGTLTEEK
jgi:hypothetical protein